MKEREKRMTAGTLVIIFPVVFLLLFLKRAFFIRLSGLFPVCPFYKRTGFLCPACGNTRSVRALLNGNLLESVGYNVTPFLLITFIVMLYIELAAYTFGARLYIIPRRYWFLTVFMILLILYYILRNFVPFLTLC